MGSRFKTGLFVLAVCLPGALLAQTAGERDSRMYKIRLAGSTPPSKIEFAVTYASAGQDTVRSRADFETVAALPAAALQFSPSAGVGDWEVRVAFDAAQCELYCSYRRRSAAFAGRDRAASGLLSPPVAVIQIYTGSGAQPATLVLDPAGLQIPAAITPACAWKDVLCLPARRLFAALPSVECRFAAVHPMRASTLPLMNPPIAVRVSAPLLV